MIYSPTRVILKQALRYMDENSRKELLNAVAKRNGQGRHFLNTLIKHFDIEQFKKRPLIKEDILIYNYLKYEYEDKLKRTGLIAKYEREFYIDNDDEFWKVVKKKGRK